MTLHSGTRLRVRRSADRMRRGNLNLLGDVRGRRRGRPVRMALVSVEDRNFKRQAPQCSIRGVQAAGGGSKISCLESLRSSSRATSRGCDRSGWRRHALADSLLADARSFVDGELERFLAKPVGVERVVEDVVAIQIRVFPERPHSWKWLLLVRSGPPDQDDVWLSYA